MNQPGKEKSNPLRTYILISSGIGIFCVLSGILFFIFQGFSWSAIELLVIGALLLLINAGRMISR